ncbi:DUF5700 domain-containing putative Zn-dependent protease [Anaeromyxobacter sp. Fw109-5]|uniref:DUF5700 domain-containing putative Zn-dependent protease n=1 Tax=Anaeromyxobacter sp. (strain Fw109-5) TaxID=404589 RepID=UPI00059CBFC4|nr:DUF5700 domain-containing putative Zn-dependent protease [Anaeromyxobacter sp. Fw109-5]
MSTSALTLALVMATTAQATPCGGAPGEPVDVAQAERMLALLGDVAAGRSGLAHVEVVLADPRTDLVIAQMNVGRTVTKVRYAQLLRDFVAGREPRLEPDADLRAQRGAKALRDVLRILRWGAGHTDLLAERLSALRRSDPAAEAYRRAGAALPVPLDRGTRLHIVMGGRAGGAAIGDDVYFDLLAYSAFESTGEVPAFTPDAAVATFAHELHHLGLTAALESFPPALHLDPRSARAFGLVKLLVLEGSATWLVDAERDPARLRRDASVARELERGDALLADVERLLQGALSGELDGPACEAARAPLLAGGFHAAGALLLQAIDRTGGRDAVLTVLRDPRRLLVSYDEAVRDGAEGRTFDAGLAQAIGHLGEDRGKEAPGHPQPLDRIHGP